MSWQVELGLILSVFSVAGSCLALLISRDVARACRRVKERREAQFPEGHISEGVMDLLKEASMRGRPRSGLSRQEWPK